MKYFEYTSVLLVAVFSILEIHRLQLSRQLNWNFSLACIYVSNCQHDKSDRYYFCIFKNQFVVYKVFYLSCANHFLNSHRQVWDVKCQCSARWDDGAEKGRVR